MIVKKQRHLLWNRERFLSINHKVDLFTEDVLAPKGPSSVQKNTKQIIVPLDLSLKLPFPIPYPNVLQLKKALLRMKCLSLVDKCTT